jgi:hypothetical protein
VVIFNHLFVGRPKETVRLHPVALSDRPDVSQVQHRGRIARAAGNAEERAKFDG